MERDMLVMFTCQMFGRRTDYGLRGSMVGTIAAMCVTAKRKEWRKAR